MRSHSVASMATIKSCAHLGHLVAGLRLDHYPYPLEGAYPERTSTRSLAASSEVLPVTHRPV